MNYPQRITADELTRLRGRSGVLYYTDNADGSVSHYFWAGSQFKPCAPFTDSEAVGLRAAVSEDGIRQAAYIDFTDKADGTPPSAMDSGQVVDFTFNAGGRRPVISGGRLVVENQAGAGSGSLADYYQTDLGEAAYRVGCEWTQPAGSDDGNGNATYAAWGAIYEGGGSNVPKSWVHMSIVPGTGATGTAKFFVCNGTGNLFVVKQQTFTNPPADGATLWRCESLLDVEAGIAYSWLPDGSLMTVTNAEIAAMCATLTITAFTFADVADSPVIMCEHYANTGANAAKFAGFTGLWGETASMMPATRKAKTQTPIDAARAAAALKASIPAPAAHVIHAPTTQLSVASTTSAANVDATNGKVTCTAGPTGKIVFEVAAYYEFSGADVLFWRMAGSVNTATRAADYAAGVKAGVIYQLIEATGLTAGNSYTYTLQHWTVVGGTATIKAGGTGGSMRPPLTINARPA